MRKTIGLQVTELDSQYAVGLHSGVARACEENDLNLILFPGRMLKSPYEFDYQYNVIYEYARPTTIDAFIMVTTTLCNYLTREELEDFVSRLSPLPIVSIGVDLPGHSSISVDNAAGMRQLAAHLVAEHGCRSIAFIRGPETNPEAESRYHAFTAVLVEHGIPVRPALVFPGDFTPVLPAVTERFLSEGASGADAVIAANDEMAVTAVQLLRAAGKEIPRDLIVAGFDDIGKARFGTPPLTTVAQPLDSLGRSAVSMALELLSGAAPRTERFQAELVPRASCGCVSGDVVAVRASSKEGDAALSESWEEELAAAFTGAAASSAEAAFATELLAALWEGRSEREGFEALLRKTGTTDSQSPAAWGQFVTRCHNRLAELQLPRSRLYLAEALLHQLRILVADAQEQEQARNRYNADRQAILLRQFTQRMGNVASLENLMDILRSDLPHLGIRSCHLSVHEPPVVFPFDSRWIIPESSRTCLSYDEFGAASPPRRALVQLPKGALVDPSLLPKARRFRYIAYPLFCREEQMGIVLFEMETSGGSFFETLCVEIASALKTSLLLEARASAERRLRQALGELKESNERLSVLSYTDELTGLYNRRGFVAFAEQALKIAARMNKSGLLFFVDVDRLKDINDTYGHSEGDEAIRATADILRATFRRSDITARIGGDEFTALTIDSIEGEARGILDRIAARVALFNSTSRKSWRLSISIGAVPSGISSEAKLEELLAQADSFLYQEKRSKGRKRGTR